MSAKASKPKPTGELEYELVAKDGERSESVTPQPKIYPICSTCEVPYVLRHVHVLDLKKGWCEQWLWQRDCKHKKAAPKLAK